MRVIKILNYLWNYFYSFSLIVLPILVCLVIFVNSCLLWKLMSVNHQGLGLSNFLQGRPTLLLPTALRAPLMQAYMRRKHKLSRPLMWSKFGQNLSEVLYILVILKLWIFFPIFYHLHSTYKQQLSQSHLGVEDKNWSDFGFPYLKDIFWAYINKIINIQRNKW